MLQGLSTTIDRSWPNAKRPQGHTIANRVAPVGQFILFVGGHDRTVHGKGFEILKGKKHILLLLPCR